MLFVSSNQTDCMWQNLCVLLKLISHHNTGVFSWISPFKDKICSSGNIGCFRGATLLSRTAPSSIPMASEHTWASPRSSAEQSCLYEHVVCNQLPLIYFHLPHIASGYYPGVNVFIVFTSSAGLSNAYSWFHDQKSHLQLLSTRKTSSLTDVQVAKSVTLIITIAKPLQLVSAEALV